MSYLRKYRNRLAGREIAKEKAYLKNLKRGQNEDPKEYVKLLDLLRQEWLQAHPAGQSYIKIYSARDSSEKIRELYSAVTHNLNQIFPTIFIASCTIHELKFSELYHTLTISPAGHSDLEIHSKKQSLPDFDSIVISSPIEDGVGDVRYADQRVTMAATLFRVYFGPSFLWTEVFSGTCDHKDGRLRYDAMVIGPFTGSESFNISQPAMESLSSIAQKSLSDTKASEAVGKISILLS